MRLFEYKKKIIRTEDLSQRIQRRREQISVVGEGDGVSVKLQK